MKNIQFYMIVGVLLTIAFMSTHCVLYNESNAIEMTPFEPVCYIDTVDYDGHRRTIKVISYLVEGFKDTAIHEAKLDSMVCSTRDTSWLKNDKCIIQIYKKSKITNNEHIKKNRKDLDRYSMDNDFLYAYDWTVQYGFSKISIKGKTHLNSVMCR
jgi:hypothetical protein